MRLTIVFLLFLTISRTDSFSSSSSISVDISPINDGTLNASHNNVTSERSVTNVETQISPSSVGSSYDYVLQSGTIANETDEKPESDEEVSDAPSIEQQDQPLPTILTTNTTGTSTTESYKRYNVDTTYGN